MDGAMDGAMLGEPDTTGTEVMTGVSSSLSLHAANMVNNATVNVRITSRFFIQFASFSLYLIRLTMTFLFTLLSIF
jgi:hypothetical protein